ncbi:uncharacterized protein CDAR_316451 [Caerostris darwini]|uniref:Osteopetrosis-associated transmembrane protein 1 n=1 Tax=Caerostris darwini TaxID=1538125 RepID=A0AAV4UKT7_9ARAC|nr:uncharacterized protein CDAR_316451 [Caerostris darwini]
MVPHSVKIIFALFLVLNVQYPTAENFPWNHVFDSKSAEISDATLKLFSSNLKSLYIFPYNVTKEYDIMSENCTLAFEKFSKAVLNFTQCAIMYARPVHICMECGNTHTAFIDAFQFLKKQGAACQSFYFGSDQLGIVDLVYNNANEIWVKSYCQNCYDYYNETEKFFQASNELIICMEKTNRTDIVEANSTCIKCHDAYVNVSASYNKFVHWKKEFVGGICMDIVDTMNISRRMWSEYDCAVGFGTTIGFPNILTALGIGSSPFIFYLLSKTVSHLEDVKLVRPKRKVTVITAPAPSDLETLPE